MNSAMIPISAYIVSNHTSLLVRRMAYSEHFRAGTWLCHLPPGVAAVKVIVGSSAPCVGDFCKEDGGLLLFSGSNDMRSTWQ